MNKRVPVVAETADELKSMMRKERNYRRRERLLALYLLKIKQAGTRLDLARLLGVSRNTVARWLRRYEEGGLQSLLDIGKPKGRRSKLPRELFSELNDRLRDRKPGTSYKEIWRELKGKYGVDITYHALYRHIRARTRTSETRNEPDSDKKEGED